MKKQIIITAILALAGLSLSQPSANAQGTPALGGTQTTNYNDGDLILGFVSYNPGTNTESTTDYILNIGAASNYEPGGAYYNPGTVYNLNLQANADLGNVAGDLSSTFGGSWYGGYTGAGAAVYYSVAGFLSDSADGNGTDKTGSLWTTNPSLTTYIPNTLGAQNSVGGNVATIGNNTISGNTSTANSDIGLVISGGGAGNYYYYEPGGNFPSQSTSFNTTWNGTTGNELTVNQRLYLNYLPPTGSGGVASTLGYFTVMSTGEVDYTAIPEPSTYASLALGALALVVWRMKRRGAMLTA